ncbi:MAG: peptidoglycan-binding protein, partial [Xanthomonadales bacterium]|nr:peptidoglycan-binding protein [Xanthomonadales bacterium]
MTVSGVHADVGGWYLRNGLSDRSMNLMTDYRNALSSQPLFQRLHETDDPRMNVVHQSHTNWKFRYTGMVDRADPEGEITRLTPDMTHATRPGRVVHVFEQAPEPANDMAQRFHAQAKPVERTLQVGLPEQAGADGLMARLARNPDVELQPYSPPRSLPAGTKAAIGGFAVSAALTGIEWSDTHQRAQVFKHTLGNETAADDAYARQTAQTAGAITGTLAGAATATALGTGSGGTLVLVAAEGYVFGKAAERAVTMWQNDKIYTQTDTAGVEWEFNGRKWIRDDLRADLVDDGQTIAHRQSFSAQPDKARELSHLASVEAVEQTLGKVPEPRSPFVQPKNGSDPAHLEVTDWTYSAESGRWSRQVANGVDRRDMTNWEPEPEYASPERAAQLSAQAMAVIDDNLKAGPAVIAARYEVGHKAYGYPGQVPDAVAAALSPDLLQASDGKHYQRDPQGVWMHEGEVASANRALELELTRERLVPALDLHQQTLASMPSWQPPTPEEADRALLRDVYLDNRWNPDIKPEQFEATYAAVQRTRAEHGIALGTTAFALDRDVNGSYSFDSPIQHTKLDANGVVQVVVTTRPGDIALAANVRTSGSSDVDTPMQAAPERSIGPLSPEARDAREQATREANREGLSRDETPQVAHAAPLDATVRVISLGPATPREAATEATDAPQTPRERAQDTPAAQNHAQAAAVASLAQVARDDEAAQQARERAQADHAPSTNTAERAQTSPETESAPAAGHREPTPEPAPQVAQADPLPNRASEIAPTAPVDQEAPQTTPPATGAPAADVADALRPGDRNDQVELLQSRLDRQGYRGPGGEQIPQTGQYGPETEHAVRQFQTLHGLPATGIADQDTRQAVDHALAAQRERERSEPGSPDRSPSPEARPAREAHEPAIETPVVRLSSSTGRDADTPSEPEHTPVARADAPPATPSVADPALTHRAVSRGDRDDERQPGHVPAQAGAADPAPAPSAPLVTQSAHPAHAMYAQALNALRTSPNIPAGTFTQHQEETLAAGLVAQALS